MKNENRAMIDAIVRGNLMRMTPKDAYGLLDDMAFNAFCWQSKRQLRKPIGVHSIDSQAALVAQVEPLQRQLNQMNV